MVIWKRLSHKNVLPFHGVDMTNFQLALVYDWVEFGNIIHYLNSHPGVSRTCLVLSLSLPRPRLFTNPELYSSYTRLPKGSAISTLLALYTETSMG